MNPLCACGCGREVAKPQNKYLKGHPGMSGHRHTEETKQEMRDSRKGDKNSFFGKKHTEESIKLMSEKAIGRPGPFISQEARERIADKQRKNWEDPVRLAKHKAAFCGSKHPNWKGRNGYGEEWTPELIQNIKERDDYKCQNKECEGHSKRIHVHHKDFSKTNHSPDNLITLCTGCHVAVHRTWETANGIKRKRIRKLEATRGH